MVVVTRVWSLTRVVATRALTVSELIDSRFDSGSERVNLVTRSIQVGGEQIFVLTTPFVCDLACGKAETNFTQDGNNMAEIFWIDTFHSRSKTCGLKVDKGK